MPIYTTSLLQQTRKMECLLVQVQLLENLILSSDTDTVLRGELPGRAVGILGLRLGLFLAAMGQMCYHGE